MRQPSIGQTVHYVAHGTPVRPDDTQAYQSECRAAIIAAVVNGTTVDLCVLYPNGLSFQHGREFVGENGSGGTWHWPEQCESRQS